MRNREAIILKSRQYYNENKRMILEKTKLNVEFKKKRSYVRLEKDEDEEDCDAHALVDNFDVKLKDKIIRAF